MNRRLKSIDRHVENGRGFIYVLFLFLLLLLLFFVLYTVYRVRTCVRIGKRNDRLYEPTPGQAGAQRAPRNKYSYFPLWHIYFHNI